jgi:hypothetical protein
MRLVSIVALNFAGRGEVQLDGLVPQATSRGCTLKRAPHCDL